MDTLSRQKSEERISKRSLN